MRMYKSLTVAILLVYLTSPAAEAASLGKVFANSAMSKMLKKDLARDAATTAKPLEKSREVWRYTTREQAARESRTGLAPGSHMTAHTTRGRPPSAQTAQARYGLPQKPQVRATWKLAPNTPVRSNKALGGAPGVGEITSGNRVPPKDLVRTTPLKSLAR